jgi:glyoxylase-like metal-dependent hydrolase (beta-lactamase superfamily II)
MPLPFVLDHINLWLLRDGAGWTIVDSGFGNDATKQLWEQIFADCLGGRPINRVIVTHLHPDHIGLAAWLAERFDVDVWMTLTEFASAHMLWATLGGTTPDHQLELLRRHGLDDAKLATMSRRRGSFRDAVPALPATLRRIYGDESIMVDGRAWRVLIGRGHSPEHASLYCEALDLMIAGDMVLPRISTNVSVTSIDPEGNPLGLFLDSLQQFTALPHDTLVLPSHGLVFYGMHERIADLVQHHDERFALVVDAAAEPQTAAALLDRLFKRELDSHQLGFAMGEAIAHLHYLMYAKQVQRLCDAAGVYRFVRASG